MTPADRSALRALAQKATPGPNPYDDLRSDGWGEGDARFLSACDPVTVLALLDIADAAEAALGVLSGAIAEIRAGKEEA